MTFCSGCSWVRVPVPEHSGGGENETAREEEESLAMNNAAIISERRWLLQHLRHSRTRSYYI